ncbi:MAG: hypothetical protein JXB85_00015 [Anaerolineales bacterium]|nr:hypothetical protein [Anaerolineales bacterium]
MPAKIRRILNALLVLALVQACSPTPTTLPPQQDSAVPAITTPNPFVAESDGPPGFNAALTAPDIVLLTWETVAGAVGYKLQIVFAGLQPLTIAYLPADATRFEHFLAPESSSLTYRLQTITSSGPAGASSLQITTLNHVPNPLAVQAVFAETGAANAVIGPAGGTLEAVDDRGVTYLLVIPPGAIDTELDITMTPVSTIDGWPLDGNLLGAVRLEPEGWLLNELAYLTIRVPAAITPALTTVGFAFNGSGEEFHLTPAYGGLSPLVSMGTGGARQASPVRQQDAGLSSLPVMELRPSGIGETSAQAAAALAVEHAPTSSSDAADQKAAVTDAEAGELTPLLSNTELLEIATTNLMTQILNNIQDCYGFKRAVGAFQAWERKAASLGENSAFRESLLEQLAEKAVETIEKAGEECRAAAPGMVPASIPCAEKLTRDIQSASNPFYTELQRSIIQNTDLKDRLTAAADSSEQCPHSFGVNEATALGFRWTSACIPSLDRPYQVAWLGPNLQGIYRLYPSNPFSGRIEGQAILSPAAGASGTIVYEGSYRIEVTQEDQRGYPLTMDSFLTFTMTVTMCVGEVCNTDTDAGDHRIPLIVRQQRCPVP